MTVFNEDGGSCCSTRRADSVHNTSIYVGKIQDSTAGSTYDRAVDITIPPLPAGALSLVKLTIPG